MMTSCVVLSTYNGENYIIEQLESLRLQTRKDFQVYIIDDCSSDNTPVIIEDYIQRYELNWNFETNSTNLGWRKSFIHAIEQVKQEIVFLCDQDDIWNNDKIKLMLSIMEANTICNVLSCDYDFLYMPGYYGPRKIYKKRKYKEQIEKTCFSEKKLLTLLHPGCSLCFRMSFFHQIIPYWNERFAHDKFIYNMSLVDNSCFQYNSSLLQFRRHEVNSSPKRKKTILSRINLYDTNYLLLEAISNFNGISYSKEISRCKHYCEDRISALTSLSFSKWFVSSIRYIDIIPTIKNSFYDLFLVFKKKLR